MKIYTSLACTTQDLLEAKNGEMRMLIDRALADVARDTMNKYKDSGDARKITIEIISKRTGDSFTHEVKITPKLAAYSNTAEDDIPEGQEQLDLPEIDENGEVIE